MGDGSLTPSSAAEAIDTFRCRRNQPAPAVRHRFSCFVRRSKARRGGGGGGGARIVVEAHTPPQTNFSSLVPLYPPRHPPPPPHPYLPSPQYPFFSLHLSTTLSSPASPLPSIPTSPPRHQQSYISHDRVEQEVLNGHETPPQEVVHHDSVVVHREQRSEELGGDGHERQVLNVRVCGDANENRAWRGSQRTTGTQQKVVR